MPFKFLLPALLVAASLVGSFAVAGAATIKTSYTMVFDRIRPHPQKNVRVSTNVDIELSQGGEIKESLTRASGRFSSQFKRGTKLGGGQWSVVGENQLRRTVEQPQSTLVMTVTTQGSSCTLDVQFTLKPGFSEYKFRRITDGTMAFFTQPNVTETRCTIQD